MANLDIQNQEHGVSQIRHDARRSAHVQRAQQMLIAAGLASLSVVAIAGIFLSQVM